MRAVLDQVESHNSVLVLADRRDEADRAFDDRFGVEQAAEGDPRRQGRRRRTAECSLGSTSLRRRDELRPEPRDGRECRGTLDARHTVESHSHPECRREASASVGPGHTHRSLGESAGAQLRRNGPGERPRRDLRADDPDAVPSVGDDGSVGQPSGGLVELLRAIADPRIAVSGHLDLHGIRQIARAEQHRNCRDRDPLSR